MTDTGSLLLALADRCEAGKPFFALDCDIFEAVGGARWDTALRNASALAPRGSAPELARQGARGKAPPYTASLDFAVTLVPGSDDVFWRVGHDGDGPDPSMFKAQVLLCESVSDYSANSTAVASAPALALCAAALRARAALADGATPETPKVRTL